MQAYCFRFYFLFVTVIISAAMVLITGVMCSLCVVVSLVKVVRGSDLLRRHRFLGAVYGLSQEVLCMTLSMLGILALGGGSPGGFGDLARETGYIEPGLVEEVSVTGRTALPCLQVQCTFCIVISC